MMKKRDLKADLELCNVFAEMLGEETLEDAITKAMEQSFSEFQKDTFATHALTGWPHAIERAMKAEALVRELVEALKEYEKWEAGLVMEDRAWSDNVGLPYFTQELYDSWMKLQDVRNEVLAKAKEVLGDE